MPKLIFLTKDLSYIQPYIIKPFFSYKISYPKVTPAFKKEKDLFLKNYYYLD